MSFLQNKESKNWAAFLSWYALVPAFATIVLMVGLASTIVTYNASPVDSKMLEAASLNLMPIRVLGLSQILLWFSIGGLLLAFASMFKPFAPIRSVFLNATGIGMIIAGAGGILNISVTEQIVGAFAAASGGDRSALVAMNPVIVQIVESHLKTGELLSGIGFLLLYAIGRTVPGFPQWLNRWIGLSGLYSLLLILLRLAGVEVPFVAIPIYVIFLALSLYVAITVGMRRALRS